MKSNKLENFIKEYLPSLVGTNLSKSDIKKSIGHILEYMKKDSFYYSEYKKYVDDYFEMINDRLDNQN